MKNTRLLFQLSFIICILSSVNGQTQGSLCTNVQNVDAIPECMYGCFCISKAGVARIECRAEPTSCLVSNECSDPDIKPGCMCPSCSQGRHCIALNENQEVVKVAEGATNVAVGCAICSCQNVPISSVFVDIVNNKLDLGNLEIREAECDYQFCPPTFIDGIDGEDGEDATKFGPGRDGADGGGGFDVNSKHFANCATASQSRNSEADIEQCDFGCFCSLESGQTVCFLPPACRLSNRCSNPVDGPCGCGTCPPNERGSCIAEGPNGEQVTISDDGPTVVGGCAVCQCEAPETANHHLYWRGSGRPQLPQRRAVCDTSACIVTTPTPACAGTDPSLVYPSASDIPPCTFGCFCLTDNDIGLCIDPAPCFVTNKCFRPTRPGCGCPTCPEVGNCIASVGDSFYLIDDDGPKTLGPNGCAVCQCNPVSEPVFFSAYWVPASQPPAVSQRNAVCNTDACNTGGSGGSTGGSSGGSTGGTGGSTGGSGGSTGGSGGSTGGSGGSTGGSGGSTGGSGGSTGGSGGSTGGSGGIPSSCDNKPCIISNKCTNPELDECGCPVCNAGNCIAVSLSGDRFVIKERRYVVVDHCARCRCLHDTVKAEFKNYRVSGAQKPRLPERLASCDYNIC
ncbi:uncharacterized protein [Antedon mediterranea]|uniref:uncharacterized protein n=1 Tax=Antedon mediterranea TaxID=105859 RepID=UPI003AF50293